MPTNAILDIPNTDVQYVAFDICSDGYVYSDDTFETFVATFKIPVNTFSSKWICKLLYFNINDPEDCYTYVSTATMDENDKLISRNDDDDAYLRCDDFNIKVLYL